MHQQLLLQSFDQLGLFLDKSRVIDGLNRYSLVLHLKERERDKKIRRERGKKEVEGVREGEREGGKEVYVKDRRC